MMTIPKLIAENGERWLKCKITPGRAGEVSKAAARLVATQARAAYVELEKATHVPWWVIAVIHEREASQDFMRSIAQGDRWNEVSRHVPKGRGPFRSFFEAGVDALVKCPPYAAQWHDWSAGGALTILEEYNGLGYEQYHAEASPYIWGATDQEEWGKYTADGRWSARVWDTQLGCAAMLKGMIAIDPSIKFGAPA
jgi:lysozyme family protein